MEGGGDPGGGWQNGGPRAGPASECDRYRGPLVITELNSEQWNRQLLGRDGQGSVVDCVKDAAGLYGTAPTCYLSLVARVPGFVRADLDRALYEERSLVRMRALRGSSFMVPVEMVDTVASAHDRDRWYGQYVEKIIDAEEREKLTREVLEILKGRVMATRDVRRELALEGPRAEAMTYLMSMLGGQRRVATATVVGGWRSNQYRYALWEEWLPDSPPRQVDPEQARVELAIWYLGGHGPATVDDFQWWGGFKKTNARAALEDSNAMIVDTPLGEMYDLPDRPPAEPASGLRLLPVWDTALITQADRRRMVDAAHHNFVYSREGNATSTVARDGRVAGIWDRQGDDDHLHIKVAPFADFDASTWEDIEAETEVLAQALGVDDLDVVRVDQAPDLSQAKRNQFLSPLSRPYSVR